MYDSGCYRVAGQGGLDVNVFPDLFLVLLPFTPWGRVQGMFRVGISKEPV